MKKLQKETNAGNETVLDKTISRETLLDGELNAHKNTRQYGIELLRLISMFFVITIHLMAGMGLYEINRPLFTFIRSFAFFAVPTFVLTSGYFLAESKFKLKRICKLWLQVVYYSVTLYVVAIICGKNTPFSFSVFAKSFLPILAGGGSFWFVQAYFLLMLASPFINIMLKNINQKQHIVLIALILLASFLGNNFSVNKILSLNYGESVLWFCALYIIGAYLKKYPINIPKKFSILIAIISVVLTWVCITYLNDNDTLKGIINITEDYDQPFTLLLSISMFLTFKNINVKNKKIGLTINKLATTSFGIYLFHDCAPFRDGVIYDLIPTAEIATSNLYFLWFVVITLILFFAGMIFDFIRQFVFYLASKVFSKTKLKTFGSKILNKANDLFN